MSRLQIMNLRPLKDVLWEAQKGRCWICEGQMRFYGAKIPEGATLDHIWAKGLYGNLGDVGVTLLAHRRCNELRGCSEVDEDTIRCLVRVWRKVDRHWLQVSLEMMEAALRGLEVQRARAAILKLFAEAA